MNLSFYMTEWESQVYWYFVNFSSQCKKKKFSACVLLLQIISLVMHKKYQSLFSNLILLFKISIQIFIFDIREVVQINWGVLIENCTQVPGPPPAKNKPGMFGNSYSRPPLRTVPPPILQKSDPVNFFFFNISWFFTEPA